MRAPVHLHSTSVVIVRPTPQAAETYLHIGNMEKYCDILVELGQWERAIATAPAVSVSYWATLCKRYADHLAGQDKLDAVGVGHVVAGGFTPIPQPPPCRRGGWW
jgi:hypothetical protein